MTCQTCTDNRRTARKPVCPDCERRLFAKVSHNAYSAYEVLCALQCPSTLDMYRSGIPNVRPRLTELRRFGIRLVRVWDSDGTVRFARWFIDCDESS